MKDMLPGLRALATQAARALLAFAAPIVMLCIGLSVSGIYPFGAESFLTEDLKYQYIDFFTWYRKVLLGEESLFYTFALSLGNNAWGLWSYYLASPFNLIVVLFPESSLVFAIFVITALKLGCIGLTSAYYLRRRFLLSFGQALVLSLCFSCSLWVFTQMRNPMWLDALILLPLVALGVWHCATEGRWGLLLASIVAAIVTCWYTAYMIVLFSILLALAEWAVARFDGESPVGLARFVTLMAGVFCLALLLAAWTFYPTIAAQLGDWSSEKTLLLCGVSVLLGALSVAFLGVRLSTRATAWACGCLVGCLLLAGLLAVYLKGEGFLENFDVSEGLLSMLLSTGRSNLFLGLFLGTWAIVDSSPQLFAGYIPLLGTICLLLSPRAGWQVRVVVGALLCVLLLSVLLKPLYYVWCGFRVPVGFYCRIAFFFVFVLVWASGYYLSRFRPSERSLREVFVPAALLALLHALGTVIVGADNESTGALGLILIAVYAIYLCGSGTPALRIATPALVFGELAISACLALPSLYTGYTQETHESYAQDASREIIALQELDSSVYRVEKTYTRAGLAALNENMALGFMSLSSYSSSYDANAVSFLKALGYAETEGFEVPYRQPILPSDSLLGVKYIFSRIPLNGLEELELEGLAEGDLLYENPDALSLGYATSDEICSSFVDEQDNPFELQNAFASAVLGREIKLFEPLEATLVQDDAETRSWEIVVPAGSAAYAWIDSTSHSFVPLCRYAVDDPSAVWADPEWPTSYAEDNWRWSHAIRTLGDVAESDRTTRVSLTGVSDGEALTEDATCLFYVLNMEVYEELVSELAREQLEVSQCSNARLAGRIEFSGEQDGILITVPYDDGWTVRVNGQVVEVHEAADGALTFISLDEAGSYDIEMSYLPPMLLAGCIVTLLSALGLVVGARIFGRAIPRTCARPYIVR